MTERQLHLFKSKKQRGVTAKLNPTEFAVHCAVADALRRWSMPGWQWTHIPLGEERPVIAGARLKRMGANRGWPDFILIGPQGHWQSRPYFLEMKREGGTLTEAQEVFQAWCNSNGCGYAIAHSYGDAIEILQRWGAVRAEVKVQ